MKKEHIVTLKEETWQLLEEIATKKNLTYRGRPSRSEVIERLVAAYSKKSRSAKAVSFEDAWKSLSPAQQKTLSGYPGYEAALRAFYKAVVDD